MRGRGRRRGAAAAARRRRQARRLAQVAHRAAACAEGRDCPRRPVADAAPHGADGRAGRRRGGRPRQQLHQLAGRGAGRGVGAEAAANDGNHLSGALVGDARLPQLAAHRQAAGAYLPEDCRGRGQRSRVYGHDAAKGQASAAACRQRHSRVAVRPPPARPLAHRRRTSTRLPCRRRAAPAAALAPTMPAFRWPRRSRSWPRLRAFASRGRQQARVDEAGGGRRERAANAAVSSRAVCCVCSAPSKFYSPMILAMPTSPTYSMMERRASRGREGRGWAAAAVKVRSGQVGGTAQHRRE